VAKVQLREADAGIAYVTDVTPSIQAQVMLLEIPDAENPIAEYSIAAVAGGKAELAASFVTYVLSVEGQKALAARGFLPPKVSR
jgi:molybdate transport system substrate-binding protein